MRFAYQSYRRHYSNVGPIRRQSPSGIHHTQLLDFLTPILAIWVLGIYTNLTEYGVRHAFIGYFVKPVKRESNMSVMFDPEAAIYPFPPKPAPLSVDEKQFIVKKSSAC